MKMSSFCKLSSSGNASVPDAVTSKHEHAPLCGSNGSSGMTWIESGWL